MKSLSEIREQLGISGPQLAGILGVERSTVRKTEKSQRYLPAKACQKLIAINYLIHNTEPIHSEDTQGEEHYFSRHDERYEDCIMQARILQRDLEISETTFQQGQNLIKLLEELQPEDNNQKVLFDRLRRTWKKKMKECSFHARQYLKDRIRLLRNEARQIREILETRKAAKAESLLILNV